MSRNPENLIEALNRLASGETRPEDLAELQQAMKSGQVTVASNGGVAVGRDVHGKAVTQWSAISVRFMLSQMKRLY
jgi:hypothetical protein